MAKKTYYEGSTTVQIELVRNGDVYTAKDDEKIDPETSKEIAEKCGGKDAITLELEVSGNAWYEPGSFWDPPEGEEEREVSCASFILDQKCVWLSDRAKDVLARQFSELVDDADIDFGTIDPDYED